MLMIIILEMKYMTLLNYSITPTIPIGKSHYVGFNWKDWIWKLFEAMDSTWCHLKFQCIWNKLKDISWSSFFWEFKFKMFMTIYSHWRSHKETTKFGGYTLWNVCYQLQVHFNLSFVIFWFFGEIFIQSNAKLFDNTRWKLKSLGIVDLFSNHSLFKTSYTIGYILYVWLSYVTPIKVWQKLNDEGNLMVTFN